MWKYQCLEHLVPATESKNAMWAGRGIHYGLAEFYRSKKDPVAGFEEWLHKVIPDPEWQSMWQDERDQVKTTQTLIHAMLRGYVDYATRQDDFEIVAVEDPIRIKIPGTRIYLIGTLDLLVRRQGQLWVIDHKSVAAFADSEYLDFDDQMTAYLWLVWQKYKEFPAGAIYNQLRKKIPAEPLLLKSGTALSKDKSIDTTRQVYLDTLLKYSFDPIDYADILTRLEQNEFYRREFAARNQHSLEFFSKQLADEARTMTTKGIPLYPTPSRDCTWACPYKALSRAESEGGDVEALKEALFKVQKERSL
jgi:hypothetical protein